MKTRFTWLAIIAACILGISAAFIGCENDVNAIVQYEGKVVHKGTTTPFPDLEVKITNGDKIHTVDHTDTNGNFTLNVRVNEIDGSYYVLVGDSSCVTKRMELSGFGSAEVNLGTIEIEGPAIPIVKTKPVSGISDTKATCGGNVTADGRSSVSARGVCWSKSEYPTIDGDHTENGKGIGEFTSQLTGLDPGSVYYVRAYAINKQGIGYGEQCSFTTATGLPKVTTSKVSDITVSTAVCGGDVDANSGYVITACGICWSDKTATPTINNDHTEEVPTTGQFTSLMIGLERNTTYYVRAYATNEKGTGYGNAVQFTTSNGLPSVTTTDVGENITESTAISGGNVTKDGGFPVVERGVCWSIYQYPTIDDNKTTNGKGLGPFSSVITGLDWNSYEQYYVRAYAINEIGIVYGEQITITKEKYLYTRLPTFNYNGYTYRLSDDLGVANFENALRTCLNLELGGYNDWDLPTLQELNFIIQEQVNQGRYDGWKTAGGKELTTSNASSAYYWTRTYDAEEGEGQHYVNGFYRYYGGYMLNDYKLVSNYASYRYRAVRKYK